MTKNGQKIGLKMGNFFDCT